MIRSLFSISLALAATLSSAVAQTAAASADPVPQAPFVASTPETGQWTVTCKYPKSASAATSDPNAPAPAKPPYQLQQMVITKTGKLKRDVCFYANGTTQDIWYSGNAVLSLDPSGKHVIISRPDQIDPLLLTERGNPLRSDGFTGVSWIKAQYFDRVTRFEKEPCFHYILKPTPTGAKNEDTGADIVAPGAEAWISVKTNLPVAYLMDNVTYVYEFSAERPSALALPPVFQAELDRYRKMVGE